MKKLLLSLMLIIAFSSLSAQHIPESVAKKYNLNNNSTFFEIQKAMNEYWSSLNVDRGYRMVNGNKTKVGGWKLYKRWENYWEQRVNLKTGEFPNTNAVDEFLKFKPGANNSDKSANWMNLGTNSTPGGYAGLGRINCVAFHPTDVNTIWVGSPSGGLWKTNNGGANWTIMNQSLPVLGVSDIVIDRNNPDIIYIATGDRDLGSMSELSGSQAADNNSIGVYKSINGGLTWNATGINFTISQKKLVYKLLIHPVNGQILYAATTDGILKTTDGGTTWPTNLYASLFTDMKFKTDDPSTIFASNSFLNQIFLYKFLNDAVDTYQLITPNGYRSEIGVTPANSSIVYVLTATNAGGFGGVFKSTNAGSNFSRADVNSPVGIMSYYTNGGGEAMSQGKYDLCIAVSPIDVNIIFIGGITTWKSVNGGVNWASNTCWTPNPPDNGNPSRPVVHADKHALAYQNSTTLFEGNDGGIYKTTNGGTNWQDLSNGLVISQIYRIGVSQTNANLILTGLQDNGTKLFTSPVWKDVFGGDGMECIVDHSNSSFMYVTYLEGEIQRNYNGFLTDSTVKISGNIPGQPKGAWVTPYIMNPYNSSILYAGYDTIYKTTDRGNTWNRISQSLSSYKIRSLAIAQSDTNVLYASDPNEMWKTTNGGATNWTAVPVPSSTYYITYIEVKNTDKNTLWITFGGYSDTLKVFESTNGGDSWTNISAGLPNIPIMSIVQYKSAVGRVVLYVGTDRGVYVKDGSNNWGLFSTGLPNVVVTELDIYYNSSGDRLRAGTFGRGLWETNISTTGIENISSEIPFKYSLGQNYPNPFNPVTKINFQIPLKGNISLKVYNQLGQEVAVLANKVMDAGYYSADFDGTRLSSGVYFCRLISGSYYASKKMILLK
ncbi:MAG TPA: T9SS type A sorting domain-containing protein [Ignavibacteria bacterium]